MTAKDREEFRGFCMQATAAQVVQIYRKEKAAGRDDYAQIARWVAEQRGIELDYGGPSHY